MRLLLPLLGVGLLLVNVVITKPMKDAIKCPKKFDYKDYVYKFLYDLRNKRKLKPLKHDPAMDEEAGKVLKDFYYAEEKEYGYVRFQGIYKPKYWEKFLQKQKVEEEQVVYFIQLQNEYWAMHCRLERLLDDASKCEEVRMCNHCRNDQAFQKGCLLSHIGLPH
ncbi:hypothetical protein Y032_0003g1197 [Ancylostoma ceylanicum]|uniref:Uncharacterized protein n=1 Tax=Ancylostoma ceylanicum TaxID=53326 RepID=A0A016VY78_9BILA|nr:hypothetical protein Y032_0003g1197 [Ancylostoma ceylanicum]